MATFNVDTPAELSDAITNSANNGQADTINITGDITLTGLLPLIEEDVQLTINGNDNTIDGNDQYRLFFVRSGTVNFNDLTNLESLRLDGNQLTGSIPTELGNTLIGGSRKDHLYGALFVFNGTVRMTNSQYSIKNNFMYQRRKKPKYP